LRPRSSGFAAPERARGRHQDGNRAPGGWLSTPRLFASGIRITSIAATPSRLLATTQGPAPSKLVQISDAGMIQPFAAGFLADPDAAAYIEVAPGNLILAPLASQAPTGATKPSGWPGIGEPGDTDPATATGDGEFGIGDIVVGSGSDLYFVSTDGHNQALVATLPPEDGPITGLAFDTVGGFQHHMLVLTSSGAVHRIDAQGRTFAIGSVGPGASGPSIGSARLGRVAGQLLVAFASEHEVRAIDAAGNVSSFMRWSGVSGAYTVPDDPRAFANSNGAVFLATSNGELYRYPLADFEARGGELLLTSALRSGSGLVTPEPSGLLRTRAFSRFVGSEVAVGFVRRPSIMAVRIDVLPGMTPKTIYLGAMQMVPVGLLASPGFTPTMLTGGEVSFAGAQPVSGGRQRLGTFTDLDGDGQMDLLLQFRTAEMQLQPGNATLFLDGASLIGDRVRGSNDVQVVAP
jgi:hypothetical protein